jgi:uncharacterized protein (TIGR03437 family)
MPRRARLGAPALFLLVLSGTLPQAFAADRDRVVAPVDPTRRVSRAGGRPVWANSQTDTGALPADFPIQHAAIVLARSPESQLAFEQLLDRQQQPGSPDYHRWLSPVEVGERFGVSPNDIAAVTKWLASEKLQVESVSNSRMLVTFSGSAAAAGAAFGAPIDRYMVNGEQRVSITSEPSVPAALAPVIRAVSGLYTVKFHSTPRVGGSTLPALFPGSSPAYSVDGYHYLTPADFATIYDLNPVYSNGINGAGQTIAIIGSSRVDNADIENFQQLFGLPVQDPAVIVPPNGIDPGPPQTTQVTSASNAQFEATADVTRASSIAPGAAIDLIVSADASYSSSLNVASQYVVDTSPVPAQIMNLSIQYCESEFGGAPVAALWDTLFSQAAAEGISVFVASGDSGAAGCDQFGFGTTPPASQIETPNAICSSSHVTCVGGTQFADTGDPSQYWSATNGTNGESALGYIPEGGWNQPLTSSGSPSVNASGGGVSAYIPTPAWQAGIAPGYQGRYTPDVSFTASCHDAYILCFAGNGLGCSAGQGQNPLCGTSATAPDMAGVAALINQNAGSPQGNLNPALYRLSVTAPSAFHDITVQSSGVTNCDVNVPSMCNNSTPSPTGLTGGLAGYLVGPGYDLVTGLGSIDVANLLANWASTNTPLPATVTTLTSSGNTAEYSSLVTFSASVTSSDSTVPMGIVTFMDQAETLGTAELDASGDATFGTTNFGASVHFITAVYGGNATVAGSTSAPLALGIYYPGCSFSLNSASQTFPAAGGSGVVNVTAGAGCFWAASSPAAWVTLTAPAAGGSSGVVNYAVAASNGDPRSATLYIAGRPFNIGQLAATPAITPAGVVNAASFTANIAPGGLASLFGTNLAEHIYQGAQVLDSNSHFVTSVAGVGVSVNGVNAPLAYVSPAQINFQVPWETPLSPAVTVQVTRNSVASNTQQIAIASAASPSVFLNNYSTSVAWVTGTAAEGCATTQCAVQAGGEYQLWANGLGPKNQAEQDGVGDDATTIDALSVVGGTANCQLTIGGIAATVDYCGAAPGLIIDQLNFTYPAGIAPGAPVAAVLTIDGANGTFLLPAPAAISSPATE